MNVKRLILILTLLAPIFSMGQKTQGRATQQLILADGFVNDATFNIGNGILDIITSKNGGASINLDGRYGILGSSNTWTGSNTFDGNVYMDLPAGIGPYVVGYVDASGQLYRYAYPTANLSFGSITSSSFDLLSSLGNDVTFNLSGGLGASGSSTSVSLLWAINNLSSISSFNAAPYIAVYDAINGTNQMALSNIDLDYFSSGGAPDGYVPTSDGSNGVVWEAGGSGSSYWTQSGGSLYPANISDEVRVGSVSDYGTYSFSVSGGNSYFHGNLDVNSDVIFQGVSDGIIFSDPTYNNWTMQSTSGDQLVVFTDGGYSYSPFIFQLDESGQVSIPNYGQATNYFSGTSAYNLEVNSNGDIIQTTSGSDFRMKKDFRTLHNSLNKILRINTYAFNWIPQEELPQKAIEKPFSIRVDQDYNDRQSAGVIAQELNHIIPEAVNENMNGYYSVDYDAIIPHLIEAIKEQQKQIMDLQKQLDELHR